MNNEQLLEEANKLKRQNKLPYRQGVIGIVMDNENNFLVVQMNNYQDNQWRWPGGGVEDDEDLEKALLREFEEELGSTSFSLIEKSNLRTKYEFPDTIILESYHKRGIFYRGQEQTQFLVKFTGNKADLKPDPSELKQIAWVPREKLKEYFVFDGQWEFAEKTLDDLLTIHL